MYLNLCVAITQLVEKGAEIYQKHNKQFLERNRLHGFARSVIALIKSGLAHARAE